MLHGLPMQYIYIYTHTRTLHILCRAGWLGSLPVTYLKASYFSANAGVNARQGGHQCLLRGEPRQKKKKIFFNQRFGEASSVAARLCEHTTTFSLLRHHFLHWYEEYTAYFFAQTHMLFYDKSNVPPMLTLKSRDQQHRLHPRFLSPLCLHFAVYSNRRRRERK